MRAIVAGFQARGRGSMRIFVTVISNNSRMSWGDKGRLRRFRYFDGGNVSVRHMRFQQTGIGDP